LKQVASMSAWRKLQRNCFERQSPKGKGSIMLLEALVELSQGHRLAIMRGELMMVPGKPWSDVSKSFDSRFLLEAPQSVIMLMMLALFGGIVASTGRDRLEGRVIWFWQRHAAARPLALIKR
jgi:hypothetical protein